VKAGKVLALGAGAYVAWNLFQTGTAAVRLSYDFRNVRLFKDKNRPGNVAGTFDLLAANPTGSEIKVTQFFTAIERYDRMLTSVGMADVVTVNGTGNNAGFTEITIPARGQVELTVRFTFPGQQLAADLEKILLGQPIAGMRFKGSLKANGLAVPFDYTYNFVSGIGRAAKGGTMKPDGRETVIMGKGYTPDIMNAILDEFNQSWKQVKQGEWAEQFRRKDVRSTIKALHNWRWANLKYIEDPAGVQYIKSPARIVADGYADCKGFSILAASILTALDIPVFFRFVSFQKNDPTYTHVYLAVMEQGTLIPVDWCLREPFVEKPFAHKQDMATKIIRLSGIGAVDTAIDWNRDNLANVRAKLALEQAQLESEIISLSGISADRIDRSQEVAYLEQLVQATDSASVAGIGKLRLPKIPVPPKVKAVVQNVTKAVTAPARAVIKAGRKLAQNIAQEILEKLMPAMAPAFLYLFVTPEIAAKMPAKEQAKRNKQIRFAKLIQVGTGITQDVFMGIVRNGIMKKMGGTPEQILSNAFAGKAKVSGIGFVDPATLSLIFTAAKKIFEFIKKHIAEKKAAGEADADELAAFDGASELGSNDLPDLAALANTGVTPQQYQTQTAAASQGYTGSGINPSSTAADSANPGDGEGNNNMLLLLGLGVGAFFLMGRNN
jgi:hypothetical protein